MGAGVGDRGQAGTQQTGASDPTKLRGPLCFYAKLDC